MISIGLCYFIKIRSAERMIGASLHSICTLHVPRSGLRKSLRTSSMRFRSMRNSTTRHKGSFFPCALINYLPHPPMSSCLHYHTQPPLYSSVFCAAVNCLYTFWHHVYMQHDIHLKEKLSKEWLKKWWNRSFVQRDGLILQKQRFTTHRYLILDHDQVWHHHII